jgi:hypothetical protein
VADHHQAEDDDVWRAANDGVAQGLREHLPGAVGVVTKGISLCAVGAFAHLALGMSTSGSAIPPALAGAVVGGSTWLRTRRSERPPPAHK